GEQRALDPDRVLGDALERHRVAQQVLVALLLPVHHEPEVLDEPQGVAHREVRRRLAHHRRGGLGDRASLPAMAEAHDRAALDRELQVDLVAAERVVRVDRDVRIVEVTAVPALAVVVQDQLLVQVVQTGRHAASYAAKYARAVPRALTNASMSSREL